MSQPILPISLTGILYTTPLSRCTWSDAEHSSPLLPWIEPSAKCSWWVEAGLALIVIACPCSIIIAMPITYACGVAALARWGVLVKSMKQANRNE